MMDLIEWPKVPLDYFSSLSDDLVVIKLANITVAKPKTLVLFEDSKVCLSQHVLRERNPIGYSFLFKDPKYGMISFDKDNIMVINKKICDHYDHKEIFRNNDLSLHKFNSFLRPSYWLVTKKSSECI